MTICGSERYTSISIGVAIVYNLVTPFQVGFYATAWCKHCINAHGITPVHQLSIRSSVAKRIECYLLIPSAVFFERSRKSNNPVTSNSSKLLTVSGTGESHRHYARRKLDKARTRLFSNHNQQGTLRFLFHLLKLFFCTAGP